MNGKLEWRKSMQSSVSSILLCLGIPDLVITHNCKSWEIKWRTSYIGWRELSNSQWNKLRGSGRTSSTHTRKVRGFPIYSCHQTPHRPQAFQINEPASALWSCIRNMMFATKNLTTIASLSIQKRETLQDDLIRCQTRWHCHMGSASETEP